LRAPGKSLEYTPRLGGEKILSADYRNVWSDRFPRAKGSFL
jgi:hypothetical protein